MKEQDNLTFDVEFMTCVIDKADDLKIVESDSHFSEFVGVHPSKIKQGKLFLLDNLKPKERETVMRQVCKKDSRYVYLNFYIKNADGEFVYVHCTGQNIENTSLCRLTLADVSRSVEKSNQLRAQAKQMNHLIDLVTGGVCLFKVSQNLHIEALYLNQTCCNLFGTDKNSYTNQAYRLDELIHPEDKSLVFQAIGKSMASKKPIDLEFRVKEHADSYIWCKCNADIQRYDSDNCPIFHAMFTDITRIKEAEEKADRESEAMVKLFKNLPGAVFCASAKNPFVLDVVSADFLKLLGCSRSEFYEKNSGDLSKYIYSSDVENAVADIANQSKNAKEGKEISTTYCVKAKDGSFITVEDKRKLIELQNGVKTELGVLQAVDTQHIDTKIYAQTILNK